MEEAAQRLLKECLETKSPSNDEVVETQHHQDISVSTASAPVPAATFSEFSGPCLRRILESATRPAVHASTHEPIVEWTDKQPGPMKTIHLTHLPLNQLLELARNTFRNLHGNISQQTIGSLLLLAYNIMNEEGQHLTSKPCQDLIDITSRITINELSNTTAKTGSRKTIAEMQMNFDEHKNKKLCMAYTYLAASYMKLFAKSAENYLKIENHLKTMFLSFYSFEFPLENFHPDLNTIIFIRRQLQHQDIYRNTFYVFLYASCENTKGYDLKDFLYTSHVSYTGLHPFSLFLQVMDIDIPNFWETLVKIMSSEGFSVELNGIMEVFNKLVKPKAGINELQMWRFARVVDSGFLNVLRTKNCVLFTLVLAYFLEIGGRSSGFLEISQIKNANESDKIVAYAYASRVSDILIEQVVIPFLVNVRLEVRYHPL
ncbi:hypothetical protein L6452_42522 [Arctium lappa]|uniref:Uncharacterized protein n=1 Tax=Arctium lappa TaxID=4217 RepID=A0ACB8XJ00_ARCLA|nr:hypothetical protein L6452_42522 [Arctium lappa]